MSTQEASGEGTVRHVFEVLNDYVEQLKNKMQRNTQRQKMDLGYLAFSAGDHHYLLDMGKVLEVNAEVSQLTPLPFCPVWLLGLTSSRGEVYSVVDFKRFVDNNVPRRQVQNDNFIALQEEGRGYILKVDTVQGIRYCEVSQLKSPRAWINGHATMDGREWLRIDLAHLVSDAKFIQNIQ